MTTTRNDKGHVSREDAAPKTTKAHSRGTSAEAQRARLLEALKRGPVDTIRAYRVLDILHVPRRVFELRGIGHPIVTSWIWKFTEQGVRHRVGIYSLEAK